jgi:hypothetical protein
MPHLIDADVARWQFQLIPGGSGARPAAARTSSNYFAELGLRNMTIERPIMRGRFSAMP